MNTNKKTKLMVGVDVSKKFLHAYINESVQEFTNDKKGIAKLISTAKKSHKHCHFVCESTGGYEDLFISLLLNKNIPVAQVNPMLIKNYIKSFGKHAKTDAIDCLFITKYAEDRTLKYLDKQWIKIKERREIQQFIDQMVKMNTQLTGNLDKYENKSLLASLKRKIVANEKLIKKYRQQLKELIEADEILSQKKQLMETVKGVGEVTSMALINTLPELGTLNRQEVATLVGLAPMHRESGTYKGKRKIHGGRARPRLALYLATVSAVRYNPEIKAFYQRLKGRGKPSMVAMIAASRKLLIHLNSIVKKEIYGI